jgi:amidase
MSFGYTGVYNLLDFAAAVVPVTRVDREVDRKVEGYKPVSEFDRKIWDSCRPSFSIRNVEGFQ